MMPRFPANTLRKCVMKFHKRLSAFMAASVLVLSLMISATPWPARGGNGKMQILNVPNWVSTFEGPRITVQFNDYLQRENIPCGDGAKFWW